MHLWVYKDKSGALDVEREYTYLPSTKFMNMKIKHLREYMEWRDIIVHKIGTNNQPID